MTEIFSSINSLPRVGKRRLELYQKLNIRTPYDLLCYYPRSYIDLSNPQPIDNFIYGTKCTVIGTVLRKSINQSGRHTIYNTFLEDSYSRKPFRVVIFNSEYNDSKLLIGGQYVIHGKIDSGYNDSMPQIVSPTILSCYDPIRLQAVYRLTAGLSSMMVSANVKDSLLMLKNSPFDTLPESIREENDLIPLVEAFEKIHLPHNSTDVNLARRRLAFDELLTLQLGMERMKLFSRNYTSCIMHSVDLDDFIQQLPFSLTEGQLSAMHDIFTDLNGTIPMNRLIQGDVGSGKTVVAMFSCFYASRNGFQSAMMAPTEILAQQHYETFSKTLEPLGIKVGLLTGSLTAKQKKLVRQQIADGELDVIVGTHALIQKDTVYQNLGLVVTDEQHRFGVSQRSELAHKGNYPHKLVMSATPIPRTLGLIIYGDLDISTIKELPSGRQPVETFAVSGKLRDRAYNYIIKHLMDGGQAYIVCPTIEENEEMELQSVYQYYEKLTRGTFKDYNLAILHGKMSPEDKERIMLDFKDGLIDLLVCTTVIEVGVDVPNASIILVENADRFGLSQLHQLRGRVGRGKRKSSCILIVDKVTPDTKSRLKTMCATNDGFKIAEEDLALRGCGDFFGRRQHGLPTLKIADLVNDIELVEKAKSTAETILKEDPHLTNPEHELLRSAVDNLFRDTSSD